jgi:hypothetical chaperone protein
MSPACGIDFGTSNSAVAFARNGSSRLLALQDGATTVPTALFFSAEDESISHGREAMERYLSQESGRLMRAIKSVLGSALFDEVTQVRSKRYSFTEITADFLRFLRSCAARELGEAPDRIVLGRPAFFVDDDPEADARAQLQLEGSARLAGFSHVEFQFEPIAAALHYEAGIGAEELALVADIGGGTSDFSIVRVSPGRAGKADRRDDILGYNGVHIGGTDFDRQLSMAAAMPPLGLRSRLKMKGMEAPSWYFADLSTWHRVNVLYEPKTIAEIKTVRRDSAEPEKIDLLLDVIAERLGHRLLGQVEEAKIALSGAETSRITLAELSGAYDIGVTRTRFVRAIGDHLDRIERRIGDLLKQAGTSARDIKTVFLTGGTSGVPAVQEAIRRAVPDARHVRGDAFGSVAAGLALDAERRFGAG